VQATTGAASDPSQSDLSKDAGAYWHALTKIDVEAAHALLEDNHPAALPEVGDTAFTTALGEGYRRALARAETVTNYPGYLATLAEFANTIGDGHVWSRPIYGPADLEWAGIVFAPATVTWAGMLVAKQGPNWVVAKEDEDVPGENLVGARIVSCDGVPINDFARDTLGRFRVVWSVEAMRVLAAPWLLIDRGNPFVVRPSACSMESGTGTRSVSLHWDKIARPKLLSLMEDVRGKAGFGLRPVGPGYWIAMEGLNPKAEPVIDSAKKQQDQLRNAPYVVVDLRGNGGGDDSYGRRLAEILYGVDYVVSKLGPDEDQAGACSSVWRASQGNIEAAEKGANGFEKAGDAAGATDYRKAAAKMKTALAAHRTLTGSLDCRQPTQAPGTPASSLIRGRVIIVTDSVCFSSCINAVGHFAKLGATLAGQSTGADTHYSEVRSETLPSGLSSFTTLQAIITDAPRDIGPYVPDYPYDGDISDTAALQAWITGTVVPSLQNPLPAQHT
jgi:hypothetical protein